MNILNRLTIKNLKLNRKRNIATIIGIMLSVALITAVATMYSSSIQSLIKYETYEKGNFHVAYYSVKVEDVENLKNNRKIENIFLTQDIGYAKLENSKNAYKPYAFVKAFTKTSLENLSVKLTEGRLPENENEIVIPTHLKTNGRIVLNVGDSIKLDVGTRVSEGIELKQENGFNEENKEKIINTKSKTYKIVGIIERPATNIEGYTAPGYTFITYLNESKTVGKVDAYCKYTKEGSKDYETVTSNILGVNEEAFKKINGIGAQIRDNEELNKYLEELGKAKYTYEINSYLIDLETSPLNNNTVGSLGAVVVIVCAIIIFTSVFCIKNSFDISITEKTKQYGMLKSIGATKKQIRKNVFFEATILGLIGIPLGLFLGVLASAILVVISNYFIGDMFTRGFKLVLAFSWFAFVFAIVLGIVTIYLSAFKSARKAAKISPIEAIRNSKEIKIKSKKLKTPKLIKKVFGVGGEISYKNLKRNKKKYRATVISITVSTFVFIALSYFMSMAFDEVKNEINLKDYNLTLLAVGSKHDGQMYQKISETTKLDNIKNYTLSKFSNCYIKNPKFTKEYAEFSNDELANEGYIEVKSVNNEQFKEYVKKLGLSYENMKDKAIFIDNVKIGSYDEEKDKIIYKKIKVFDYNIGENVKFINSYNEEFEMKLGASTDILPFGIEETSNYFVIVSDEMFEKNLKSEYTNVMIYYDSSNPDKLQDDIDELLSGYNYNINNVEENARMMEKLYTLVGIFLYGFIIVITLIGVTNVFNTITTNMELRKPEFAMLKSIGMTTNEFNKMIRLETIFMGIKSLLFSIPIGIGLSYLIYNALDEDHVIKFAIPINAIIISVIAVFLLITCIMKYSMNKISKQNTIETIRNENI